MSERASGGEHDAISRGQASADHALDDLIASHGAPALRLAQLLVNNAALAETIAQDSFLLAHRNLHQLPPDAPFLPWLLRFVILLARARRRAALRLARVPDRDGPAPIMIPARGLAGAFQALPAQQREALALWCCFGFDEPAIGLLIGASPDVVGDAILDGLQALATHPALPDQEIVEEHTTSAVSIRRWLRDYAGTIVPRTDIAAAVHSKLHSGQWPLDRALRSRPVFVILFSIVTLIVLLGAIAAQFRPLIPLPPLAFGASSLAATPPASSTSLSDSVHPLAISPSIAGVTLAITAITADSLRTAIRYAMTLPPQLSTYVPDNAIFIQDRAGHVYQSRDPTSQGFNGTPSRSPNASTITAQASFAPLLPAARGTVQWVSVVIPSIHSAQGTPSVILGPWRATFSVQLPQEQALTFNESQGQTHQGLTLQPLVLVWVQRVPQFDGLGNGLRVRVRLTGLPATAGNAFSFATTFVSDRKALAKAGAPDGDHFMLQLPGGPPRLANDVVPVCRETFPPQAFPPACDVIDQHGVAELDVIFSDIVAPTSGISTLSLDRLTLRRSPSLAPWFGPWMIPLPSA